MNIKDLDLSSLRYDPSSLKEIKRLREEHPDTFSIEMYEDSELIQYDEEILRYIILVYDMNSPLWVTMKNHNERKVKAMLYVGFNANGLGKFNNKIEQALLYGRDSGVAIMIVKYVYLFNSIDYSELVGMIEINSKILRDIHNNKSTKDTMNNLSKTSSRIKELTANIFGGQETKEIEEQLYEQLNMSRISFRPEMIVRQLASGNSEDVFAKNLYGNKRRVKKGE